MKEDSRGRKRTANAEKEDRKRIIEGMIDIFS